MKLIQALLLICFYCSACGSDPQRSKTDFQTLKEMIQEVDQAFSEVPHISVKEVQKLKIKDFVLIDVREKKEQEVSTLPNAISLEKFKQESEKHKHKTLIPFCTIGYRSAIQTQKFINQGFKAKNLRGSVLSWAWEGLLFQNQSGNTSKVHVYGSKWDLLPEGYESVK